MNFLEFCIAIELSKYIIYVVTMTDIVFLQHCSDEDIRLAYPLVNLDLAVRRLTEILNFFRILHLISACFNWCGFLFIRVLSIHILQDRKRD